jgi:myo-inositol 2-dehydrogenase/D-chiro-inositol 1-dehydrogenase
MTRDAGFAVSTDRPEVVRRIGLLGCGRIGRLHADILLPSIAGFELVAVADVVPRRRPRVSPRPPARVSRAIEDLLAADDIDTVAICTSTDTHVDLVVAGRGGRQGDLLREAGQPRPTPWSIRR